MLVYLLRPEDHENISSTAVKLRVLQGFDVEIDASASVGEIDAALRTVRARAQADYPDRDDLDLFRPPLIDRWDPMEVEAREFIDDALLQARSVFQKRFPDFETFEEPGSVYVDGERGYKDVFRSRFMEVYRDIPDPGELDEEKALELVAGLRRVLSEKLHPYDWSQNLINWRYTAFLKELDPGEAVRFVDALTPTCSTGWPGASPGRASS